MTQAGYPIATMCRLLKVSTSGDSRVHAELTEAVPRVRRKPVARLMRGLGLQGVRWRNGTRTTVRHADRRPAADLVNVPSRHPDRLWVADITCIRGWVGFLNLAVVLDAFGRRIVGWAMAPHLRITRVLGVLEMAVINAT